MANDDFLKKLQESLKAGEKNSDIVNHLNEIDKRASQMTGHEAAQKMDDRIKEFGETKEVSEKERQEAEEELAELMSQQKENDEKLKFLSSIEGINVEIKKTKDKFSEIIEVLQQQKITLMTDFEKRYGEKAEDLYDFGPEPNTELD